MADELDLHYIKEVPEGILDLRTYSEMPTMYSAKYGRLLECNPEHGAALIRDIVDWYYKNIGSDSDTLSDLIGSLQDFFMALSEQKDLHEDVKTSWNNLAELAELPESCQFLKRG